MASWKQWLTMKLWFQSFKKHKNLVMRWELCTMEQNRLDRCAWLSRCSHPVLPPTPTPPQSLFWPTPVLLLILCQHFFESCLGSCPVLSHSVVSDSVTPWTVPHEPARLFHLWRFSRQEYWSGLPCPPLGDLPNPGIEPGSAALQADSLLSEAPGKLCLK